MNATEIIEALALAPHPEGGYYRETWRDRPEDGSRGAASVIYFLLTAGQRSRRHRIDAVEHWHYHAGAPLRLEIESEGGLESRVLGPDIAAGQRPLLRVPAHAWQAATSTGPWTLVSCTVAPAFLFDKLEMADGDL